MAHHHHHHQQQQPTLKLGVNGKLSNQEMELLREKLAKATAYNHAPVRTKEDTTGASHNPRSKPMTKVYHRVEPSSTESSSASSHGPKGRKTLAAITYEKQFQPLPDQQVRRAPTKGIDADAKIKLQEEYNRRPRQVSIFPTSSRQQQQQQQQQEDPTDQPEDRATGKRHASPSIPQVFIM